MESRSNRRTISFNPSDRFYGKNTCQLDPIINSDELPLDKIFTVYQAHLLTQNDVIEEYEGLIAKYKKMIKNVSNADDSDTLLSLINEDTDHIWDSQLVVKTKFAAAVKKIGVTFDKDNGVFVDPPKKKAKAEVVKDKPAPPPDTNGEEKAEKKEMPTPDKTIFDD
jgi:hypothetical protein